MSAAARPAWERSIVRRLRRPDPDQSALMDLYDYTSAVAWSYARQLAPRSAARAAIIDVYRSISDRPSLIADVRVPLRLQLCVLVQRQLVQSTRC